MALRLSLDDLRPNTVVRVGLRASGAVGRSYRLLVVRLDDAAGDGRVRVQGDRLTLAGRVVERLTIEAALDDLRADDLREPQPGEEDRETTVGDQ